MPGAAELAGKVALITGGGYGLGREIALRLARDGADIVLAARSADALAQTAGEIEALGRTALCVPTDVADQAQVQRLSEAVGERFAALDVLVCNSGIAGPIGDLWELDSADWERTIAVNLIGVFHVCRALMPAMIARRQGSVVVIGSATGKRPMRGRTPYAASKLGLVGLVRSLALDAGRHGVRVNLISPGPVAGERIETVLRRQSAARGVSAEEVLPKLVGSSALGRLTEPQEVADAVAYLAGDGAAAITGEDLNVSSGWVMW